MYLLNNCFFLLLDFEEITFLLDVNCFYVTFDLIMFLLQSITS